MLKLKGLRVYSDYATNARTACLFNPFTTKQRTGGASSLKLYLSLIYYKHFWRFMSLW